MMVTIYELLGMVKDGNIPKKIKIDGHRYKYNYISKDYDSDIGMDNRDLFLNIGILEELNTPIEIIEEPQEHKIPKKLESYISCGWAGTCKDLKREDLFNDLKKIGSKINEILDYLEVNND